MWMFYTFCTTYPQGQNVGRKRNNNPLPPSRQGRNVQGKIPIFYR
jgi:hypothetical protein